MVAIYAGSFDPITYGHIDVIEQCLKMFNLVHVVIGRNPGKDHLFTQTERYNMVSLYRSIKGLSHKMEVTVHDGLIVDLASNYNDPVLVRGVRGMTDMISEMALADVNEELSGIKTIFIPTSNENRNFSSSLVKELWMHGRDVSKYCPPYVVEKLKEKR